MGLRVRVTLSLLVPLLVILGVHGLVRVRQERAALLEAHEDALGRSADVIVVAIEDALRAQAPEVGTLLARLARPQQHLTRIRLYDRNGTAIATWSRDALSDRLPIGPIRDVLQRNVSESAREQGERGVILSHVAPVRGRDGDPVGAVEVVEVATAIQAQMRSAILDVWLRLALVAAAVAVATGLVLQRQIFDRLSSLRQGIVALGTGRSGARVRVDRRDELGHVGEAFNDMAAQLDRARLQAQRETERALDLQHHLQHTERLAIAGKLASGLAHEIGTPLNIISGRAEMLLDSVPPSDPRRAELSAIVDQIDRIAAFMRSLLDTARRDTPQREAVAVGEVVHRLWPLMEHAARRRSVRLTSEVAPDLPKIFADPNQLQQIVINLLMNAFEATPPGGRATLSARREDRDGRTGIAIDVHDTGPGVRPSDAARIFEPFFSTKPSGQGTGLGLPISRDIARELGGDISLAPSNGGGATLRVWLPTAHEMRHAA